MTYCRLRQNGFTIKQLCLEVGHFASKLKISTCSFTRTVVGSLYIRITADNTTEIRLASYKEDCL